MSAWKVLLAHLAPMAPTDWTVKTEIKACLALRVCMGIDFRISQCLKDSSIGTCTCQGDGADDGMRTLLMALLQ